MILIVLFMAQDFINDSAWVFNYIWKMTQKLGRLG